MKIVNGGITKPKGFLANGLCCGIKKSGKNDLGLIYSEVPAITSAVFTKNSVKAAPLYVSKKNLKNNKIQAIIVNSGNANCFTGKQGFKDAEDMAIDAAKSLAISSEDIIVSSTGIIGKLLPANKILKSIPKLAKNIKRNSAKALEFEKSILTTDLNIKSKTIKLSLSGKDVFIGGCAKGSGMIAPNMATMLGFITTDLAISSKMLNLALKEAVANSFNCITVDGCISTNDMVVLMANGLADNDIIKAPCKDFKKFLEALKFICLDLAKKIVLDGEGATKFIEINIFGAKTDMQAKQIGLAIANSNLVKTAAYGCNPNWGRVASAVGSLGINEITEENLKIEFSSFKKKNISINVSLNLGKSDAKVYTSDLSYEYVRINGEYN